MVMAEHNIGAHTKNFGRFIAEGDWKKPFMFFVLHTEFIYLFIYLYMYYIM